MEDGKFKKFLIENDMMDIGADVKSNMYKKDSPEAMPFIEKLIKFKWSDGKKMQRESARCFNKLAESNDKVSNKFLKEVDDFCSGLKKKYINEEQYSFVKLS